MKVVYSNYRLQSYVNTASLIYYNLSESYYYLSFFYLISFLDCHLEVFFSHLKTISNLENTLNRPKLYIYIYINIKTKILMMTK